MIGLLRGRVIHKQPPDLLIEVQGVGYEVQASMNTFYALPIDNQTEVLIYTHLVVREDAQILFGFVSQEERALFRNLLKVNGVGPKMALAIVSNMTTQEFHQVIHRADLDALCRIPGVGKKTAERLVVELRDRLPKSTSSEGVSIMTAHHALAALTSPEAIMDEALNALLALGYKQPQADKMLAPYKNQTLRVEELIRLALRASLN